jgi:tetratricopeptide (TPR) repeat protein
MKPLMLFCLVLSSSTGTSWAQRTLDPAKVLANQAPESRTLFGGGLLPAGANELRMGNYDEGIKLTLMGLEERGISDKNKAAAHANLCAAYAAKQEPDVAIEHCTLSLEISGANWQAWSNRSYAYWLKGMYPAAMKDLEVAIAMNPDARQIFQIRGMLNEAVLLPRVEVQDHQ